LFFFCCFATAFHVKQLMALIGMLLSYEDDCRFGGGKERETKAADNEQFTFWS